MGPELPFTIEVTDRGGLTVLALSGELDLSTSPQLADALDALAHDDRRVVVDLRDLGFMDSTGLAVILRYHQRAKDGTFDLVVVRGPEAVDRVFRVTQSDTLLEMLDVPPA